MKLFTFSTFCFLLYILLVSSLILYSPLGFSIEIKFIFQYNKDVVLCVIPLLCFCFAVVVYGHFFYLHSDRLIETLWPYFLNVYVFFLRLNISLGSFSLFIYVCVEHFIMNFCFIPKLFIDSFVFLGENLMAADNFYFSISTFRLC